TLIGLNYDPERWFSEPRTFRVQGDWNLCTRYGRMNFPQTVGEMQRLIEGERAGARLLVLCRPEEFTAGTTIHEFRDRTGDVALLAVERALLTPLARRP